MRSRSRARTAASASAAGRTRHRSAGCRSHPGVCERCAAVLERRDASLAGERPISSRWPSHRGRLDQITKALVDRCLDAAREPRRSIDGLLSLTYVRNRGAAFGILSDADLPYQSVALRRRQPAGAGRHRRLRLAAAVTSRLPQPALALIMGGASATCSTARASAT